MPTPEWGQHTLINSNLRRAGQVGNTVTEPRLDNEKMKLTVWYKEEAQYRGGKKKKERPVFLFWT